MKLCVSQVCMILALLLVEKVESLQYCPKDNYIIIDTNGAIIECLLCQDCVEGSGLSPPCGKKLTPSEKGPIDCYPCKPGTFSVEYGPSSCKLCRICSVTKQNCTAENDTECSKACGKGKYFDNATHNCQQCSHCCGNNNKKIAECIAHGLPPEIQCSVHDALGCSPQTTTVPNDSNDDSNGDETKNTMEIVIGVVLALIVVIIGGTIVFLVWWFKYRTQRHIETEEDPQEMRQPLEISRNNCDISKSSFFITISPVYPNGSVKEGVDVSLVCADENQNSQNNNHCLENCVYEWKKDMDDYEHGGKTLNINHVKVSDFGKYTCQVKCKQHQDQHPINANELILDVFPERGKRYKKFNELTFTVHEDIAKMLTPPKSGIGNWKHVAERYRMSQSNIAYLESNNDRATQVIRYITSSHPKLTVYVFCKFMKEIKQNEIVELLENSLTCKEEEKRLDVRDSGYDQGTDNMPLQQAAHHSSHQPVPSTSVLYSEENQVALTNSRPDSIDELTDIEQYQNSRQVDRQVSNQSTKSSGSGSFLNNARNMMRQISYTKHENDDDGPA